MSGFILFHYFSSIPELNVMIMTNNSRVFGVALHSPRGWISETADLCKTKNYATISEKYRGPVKKQSM